MRWPSECGLDAVLQSIREGSENSYENTHCGSKSFQRRRHDKFDEVKRETRMSVNVGRP